MSAPSPDTGGPTEAESPPDAPDASDASDTPDASDTGSGESGGAVESATAEPAAVGDEPAGDTEPDLAAVAAERDAYLADLQRVTAEFTNFRRQTMKRNTELVAQAASRLARELLVVLDACEAAVGQGVEGIEALQSQLLGVLSAEGLSVLGTVDEPFDPGFHEAVMSEESTGGSQDAPVVSEVLRTGYAWNGRVLRPAMVKVRA